MITVTEDEDQPLDFSKKTTATNGFSHWKKEKAGNACVFSTPSPSPPDNISTHSMQDTPTAPVLGQLLALTSVDDKLPLPSINSTGLSEPKKRQYNGSTRPFKAYQSLGFGGLPIQTSPNGISTGLLAQISDVKFQQYRQQVLNQKREGRRHNGSTGSLGLLSPQHMQGLMSDDNSRLSSSGGTGSSGGEGDSTSAQTTPTTTSGGRRKAHPLPEEQKDDAYWERRKKNNEAAKRSRDARRAKEDEIAMRAAFLEQENLRLQMEIMKLQQENMKLRNCILIQD